ncbi:MAG: hypothetical protein NC253_11070 [Ruminococcus sp.]|nr:hypothetical protein [Ruminococcus sp.]MCM1380312.1 hypothetical protein [Muribaculaceae bacterium]MCM1478292.1 hypothetical protein [Muribaculaceae bacterium]
MTRNEILKTAKPILFNSDMVRAILDGRKTVTRRIVKQCHVDKFTIDENGKLLGSFDGYDIYPTVDDCLYQVGDILYVRETWRKSEIDCDNGVTYFYYADGFSDASARPETGRMKWRPSIHMPKEAARLFLRVTDVRAERLQDITEEQAINEGCNGEFVGNGEMLGSGWKVTPQDEFSELWDSTVKKSDLNKYGWKANPWVWVIEFEKLEVE